MNPILRNILAVLFGWLSGSILNMGLIRTGHLVFPIKDLDPDDMDALAQVMPTLDVKYFIFPFLAHALGTLLGATIAGWIASSQKMKFSIGIGLLFLLGGIWVNYVIPGPVWFTIADIAIAYLPMAWLGGKMAQKLSKKSS
jgi:hypothetical protein